MASATFYNAAKKQNSTLRPSGGTVIDVKLKDGVDLINPVFILNYGSTPTWTSAFFEGRYYFVTSIESVRNDLWAVACRVDALATYRSQIGAQTLYVVRSSNRFDGAIVDQNYPVKTGIDIQTTNTPAFYDAFNFTGGTYVVGIINSERTGAPVGAVSYYAFTQQTFRNFLNVLMGNISRYEVDPTEVSEPLQKMLFNPFQYIASCIWFPFDISNFQGTDSDIYYGWWKLSDVVYGKKISSVVPIDRFAILPTLAHPQQQSRGAYLSGAPYTKKLVRCMPFGMFEVDPQIYYGATPVYLNLKTDIVTGAGVLMVYKTENEVVKVTQTLQAQIGVQIQLAQMNLDFQAQLTAEQATLGVAASLTKPSPFGFLSADIAAVGSAELAKVPTLQSTGLNGGIASLQGNIECINQFMTIADEDNAHRGRPYCQMAQIGSVGGFMVVADADFDIACTDTERAIIKQYMESGFYYE